jgi:hypothetical protein
MNLYEKIIALYPSLTAEDFIGRNATILLQDNSDGNGAYIAKWEHPTLSRPTEEELA